MPTTNSLKDGLRSIVENDHARLAVLHDLGRQRKGTPPAACRVGSRYTTFPRPLEVTEFPVTNSRVDYERRHFRCVGRELAEQQLLFPLIEWIRLTSAMSDLRENLPASSPARLSWFRGNTIRTLPVEGRVLPALSSDCVCGWRDADVPCDSG